MSSVTTSDSCQGSVLSLRSSPARTLNCHLRPSGAPIQLVSQVNGTSRSMWMIPPPSVGQLSSSRLPWT